MNFFNLLLLLLLVSCSTTRDGKMVFDPKPIDEAAAEATKKIKKDKDYCSPLDKISNKCE